MTEIDRQFGYEPSISAGMWLKAAGLIVKEAFTHPLRLSTLVMDPNNHSVRVEAREADPQLSLEGFEEQASSIPAKLRLIAAGKLVWEAFCHPLTGSTLIMDPEADEVRVVHWNNPKELIEEQERKYKSL